MRYDWFLNERSLVDANVGVGVLDARAPVPGVTFALSTAWDEYPTAAYQNGKMVCVSLLKLTSVSGI